MKYTEIREDWKTDAPAFWANAAKYVTWMDGWNDVLEEQPGHRFSWFDGAFTNASYNCLDRHVETGRGEQVAIAYESPVTGVAQTITYAELTDQVGKFACVLESQGVGFGDIVVIYMPVIPQAIIAMLACARIGATHCVVFGGFAAKELATRLSDTRPKAIVTASCGFESKRRIPYKETVDEAAELAAWEGPVILYQRETATVAPKPEDIDWDAAMRDAHPSSAVSVPSGHPLYILHTSGTTGAPKGIVRDTGGYMTSLIWSMNNIYRCLPGDVFWAASDIGWVVGHSYMVYGPLLNGCTTVLYEGKPVGTPDPASFWRVVAKHRVNVLFTAPTALRAIRKEDPDGKFLWEPCMDKRVWHHDVSCLRSVFLAGERCDTPTVKWAEDLLGVPAIDHWWQTESGWAIAASTVEEDAGEERRRGSAGRAMPGWDVCCIDDDGNEVPAGVSGNIVCGLPLPPGVMTTIWKAHSRYESSYFKRFPGWYDTGDAGYIDADGFIYVMGRTDDVINVAGHRFSTGAIEEVVARLSPVAECAVVGMSHPLKGQVPVVFMVLKDQANIDSAEAESRAMQAVREHVGAVTAVQAAFVVNRLPKTRSGKILRRSLLQIVDGKTISIPPTIDDPEVLSEIEQLLRARGIKGESLFDEAYLPSA
ncbi:AMP-binding protein [Caballeronia sp. SEWSISQ10-4 2]|jgi:propionyl-CoA synthetase|uniref:AMP-binding protein n=1 Tax=Caballeronia sp. SEWSISQ10-4 2 TaxID=2937438 RepID=UPI002651552E|nr:AMP-binding protein [Caballeronia sp. SEWSISQ10-4 2]MDN7177055.1 AMP-binding protein [Caballeronia sp. SEWSISQ10-4 2]